jgi:hypothetical protein
MEKEVFRYFLDWLSVNTPSLVELLTALVPVMALALAGYALYVVTRKRGRK